MPSTTDREIAQSLIIAPPHLLTALVAIVTPLNNDVNNLDVIKSESNIERRV